MTLSLLHDRPAAAELPTDSRGRRGLLRAGSPRASTAERPAQELAETVDTAHWGGVFAMTLCVFALIASEFMPVSLLTPIASALRVSEGLAGQGIAISGAFAVLTSLVISRLSGRVDRRTLLLSLTALMGVSGAMVGAANGYLAYMVGRALIGVVVGGFWSMSAATAMQLVPTAQVPRALAMFNGGNALATVVAAPVGSYLGAMVGWRGAFFCLVPIAAVAFVWQWVTLPSMPPRRRPLRSGNILTLLKRRLVMFGMLAVGAFFMGQFALFTYLRPFLETVTRVDVSTLSLILLALGIAGFVGTTVIGYFLRKVGLYATLAVIPVAMAAIALTLVVAGASTPATAVLLTAWGLFATAAPVGWWLWLARSLPDDADAGGGLMVAVVQLSIALGSTVGGLLFDHVGHQATFAFSAGLLLIAAALVFATSRGRPTSRGLTYRDVPSMHPHCTAPCKPFLERPDRRLVGQSDPRVPGHRHGSIRVRHRRPSALEYHAQGSTSRADDLRNPSFHSGARRRSCCPLPRPLPVDAFKPGIIHAGDVMLYGSDTLVVFYETFPSSYSYTRIGRVADGAGLARARGLGSQRITFAATLTSGEE